MIPFSADETQFIHDHLTDDVRALLLRSQPTNLDIRRLATQIAARQKARYKLPTWYAHEALIFPQALSVEQASSEQTAHYKASLVSGKRLLDLTGGMGVDAWAFAKRVDQVVYVEQQPDLAALAAYNLPLLGATNVLVQTGNGLALAADETAGADWIYLDPHRRDDQGHKVVRLGDCEPDLSQPDTLSALLHKANRILVKASPLLDIDATVRQLATIDSIQIVAVQGEVKEVLFIVGNQPVRPDSIGMTAVNLTASGPAVFAYTKGDEVVAPVTLSDPLLYVYEPNAAILKAGAFRIIGHRFGLNKLAPNSHLYTSDAVKANFPGRIFQLTHCLKPDRKTLQMHLPSMKANLTTRNFPQSVAELRKQLGLRDGGDTYILATTLQNGDKRLLITKKVNQETT